MIPEYLINTDISKMSELEFKTTITRILAGVEKKHRRHQRISFCSDSDRRTKIYLVQN